MGNFFSSRTTETPSDGNIEVPVKTQFTKSKAHASAPNENLKCSEECSQSIFSTPTPGHPTILVVKSTSEDAKHDDDPQSRNREDFDDHIICPSTSSTSTTGQPQSLHIKSSEVDNYDELDGPQSISEDHRRHTMKGMDTSTEETHPKKSKSKKKKNRFKQMTSSKTNPMEKNPETPSISNRNPLSPRTNSMIEDVIEKGEYKETEAVDSKLKLQIKKMTLKAKEVEINCIETEHRKKFECDGDHFCLKKFLRSMQNIENFIIELKNENNKINNEKSDYMNRLSQLAGAKLRDNNPNITDLKDTRRPMKIAEEYNKLYDDQWTDAMEHLEKIVSQSDNSQEKCVHHLFSVIKAVYKCCKQRSEVQLQGLAEHTFLMNNPSIEQIDAMLLQNPIERQKIVDNRKQTAIFAVEMLQQTMVYDVVFKTEIERCRPQLDDQMLAFLLDSSYLKKCIEVCWYMVIQDPPMYLETLSLDGSDLDKDTHKVYLISGNKVQYVVWPALYQYLHNNGRKGPVMIKGVVQVAN